jgi:hypothetical protein
VAATPATTPALPDTPRFPLGRRGERPIFIPCTGVSRRLALRVPGVIATRGGVRCTWDAAPFVSHAIGRSWNQTPPTFNNVDLHAELLRMPGLRRWKALGLTNKMRKGQKMGALFLARLAWGLCCDPMRTGKTRTFLGAAILIDARQTLIIGPAQAKPVWALEIAKVLDDESLMLEGKAGSRGHIFCKACMGRGILDSHEAAYQRAVELGWNQTRLNRLAKQKSFQCPDCAPARGPSTGYRVVSGEAAIEQALAEARWVIGNYDILPAHIDTDDQGGEFTREDLPGWAGKLAQIRFDCCIADEIQGIRGFSTDPKRRGKTRRERFIAATDHIPVCWGGTGTLIFGFARDPWGPLDAISQGAASSQLPQRNKDDGTWQRLPFQWHKYYCEGAKGEYGWEADGRSVQADTEMPERLAFFQIKRKRKELVKDMPDKIREIYRVEPKSTKQAELPEAPSKAGLRALLGSTAQQKLPTLVENVVTELANGYKAIVFCFVKDNTSLVHAALEQAIEQNDVRTRMAEVDARIWVATGDVEQMTRFKMGQRFCEHRGAGVMIATIDSMQVAISLFSKWEDHPTATVHFLDLHWSPAALLQAEDRPYEPGTKGLTIAYYILQHSADEHIEQVVLPKVKTLHRLANEEGAKSMQEAFAKPQETLAELYKRLWGDVNEEDYEDD